MAVKWVKCLILQQALMQNFFRKKIKLHITWETQFWEFAEARKNNRARIPPLTELFRRRTPPRFEKKTRKKSKKKKIKKKELAECTRRGRSYLHFSGKLRGITWKTNPPCSNVIRRRPRSSAECSGCDSHFSDRWRSPRRRKRRPWLPWWFRLPSSRCSYRNARLQKKNERKRTSG